MKIPKAAYYFLVASGLAMMLADALHLVRV